MMKAMTDHMDSVVSVLTKIAASDLSKTVSAFLPDTSSITKVASFCFLLLAV